MAPFLVGFVLSFSWVIWLPVRRVSLFLGPPPPGVLFLENGALRDTREKNPDKHQTNLSKSPWLTRGTRNSVAAWMTPLMTGGSIY